MMDDATLQTIATCMPKSAWSRLLLVWLSLLTLTDAKSLSDIEGVTSAHMKVSVVCHVYP